MKNVSPVERDERTIYKLRHAGWKRGVEQFENEFSWTVQGPLSEKENEEIAIHVQKVLNAYDELLEATKACWKYGVIGDEYKESLYTLITKLESK